MMLYLCSAVEICVTVYRYVKPVTVHSVYKLYTVMRKDAASYV